MSVFDALEDRIRKAKEFSIRALQDKVRTAEKFDIDELKNFLKKQSSWTNNKTEIEFDYSSCITERVDLVFKRESISTEGVKVTIIMPGHFCCDQIYEKGVASNICVSTNFESRCCFILVETENEVFIIQGAADENVNIKEKELFNSFNENFKPNFNNDIQSFAQEYAKNFMEDYTNFE